MQIQTADVDMIDATSMTLPDSLPPKITNLNGSLRPGHFLDGGEDLTGLNTNEIDSDFPIFPIFSKRVWPNKSTSA